MTLLQDLMLTSRTVYEREKEFLLSEMTREAHNFAGMLRGRSWDDGLLDEARQRAAYWRQFLTDLRDERERRDQAIREFCKQSERAANRVQAAA
ncbi:MAG TPA: hypothetical protein VGX78_10525 [Pirellulales bacterium]|jgi:hypothetical protein|nr:hypothetical protein [Pirellulales bacterium]